jgi:hypothetical protein
MSDLRDMSEVTRIRVARSELVLPTVIYESATQIFAHFISAGKVTDENQKSAMQKAINMAVELAIETDRMVDADSGDRHHFNR